MPVPSTNSNQPRKWSDHENWAALQGIKHVVGSARSGVGLQSKQVTATGTTYAFVFANEGLEDMEDANYSVIIKGVNGDETYTTRATTGFTITQVANLEVLEVLVIGRLAGMVPQLKL